MKKLPNDASAKFLLEATSDRFEILQRRYALFRKEIPARFERWLAEAPAHKKVFATFESVCAELFPELLTPVPTEIPHRWMMPVACAALKHHIADCYDGIQLSACCRAFKVEEKTNKRLKLQEPECSLLSDNVLFLRTRNAALEVRVAELEQRLQKRAEDPKSTPEEEMRCKYTKPKPKLDSPEHALAYILERRAEALDVFFALKRARTKRACDEKRLGAANAEIGRLRAEIEMLRRPPRNAAPEWPSAPILPKRALSMAGYWNLLPNDLLLVTPALIEAVGRRGGEVIRREGMQPCFSQADRGLLLAAAMEVMSAMLPHYERRTEEAAEIP